MYMPGMWFFWVCHLKPTDFQGPETEGSVTAEALCHSDRLQGGLALFDEIRKVNPVDCNKHSKMTWGEEALQALVCFCSEYQFPGN